MAVQTSAGSTLSIATGTPATNDAAGFLAMTWVLVSEITNLGEFGRVYTSVPHNPIGERGTKHYKGSYNNGSMALTLARDATAAGQIALKAALMSDADYSFKVTYQDATRSQFLGKVLQFKTTIGGVDSITGLSCTIELSSSDIVES